LISLSHYFYLVIVAQYVERKKSLKNFNKKYLNQLAEKFMYCDNRQIEGKI